jgi:hypothetical protein
MDFLMDFSKVIYRTSFRVTRSVSMGDLAPTGANYFTAQGVQSFQPLLLERVLSFVMEILV